MRVINEQTKGFCIDRTFQNQPAEMCTHYCQKNSLRISSVKELCEILYSIHSKATSRFTAVLSNTETVFFIKLLKMMFADFKLSTMKIKVHAYLNPNSKFQSFSFLSLVFIKLNLVELNMCWWSERSTSLSSQRKALQLKVF